ncbi:MAG TPA: zinc ribbon domain-containing protein [Spirochaetota bacterium]|nr:zinc ribbon domain-containing protein [Spirochaetota bacterium]HPC41778.1 zinc ribbon domain-containing protein [Spirochaetota bacterium]HPL16552.1 zinc ribbon domain-containing protein [Spirochaetota bacterium]HQF06623.1 zinc ribbon domain-containing protein [Spirochaetota bacterium]HQH95974.1 zinc ribbon domain-containing protein [Spirochaetota bacterium]
MPTYEYECLECKNRFDVFQSMNDAPVANCVKCGGKVRKLFNTAGIIFKGSGFYVNDYKKNGDGKKDFGKGNGSEKNSTTAADSCPAGCAGGAAE